MSDAEGHRGRGPFRADQVREGDRYELTRGHPVYCAPTGARGGRASTLGGQILDTDPLVTEAGIDVGYAIEEGTLRAPDVSVGNVPNAPGWVKGVPPLAVEYADTGQDENDLTSKIAELLTAGTRHVWVVRLTGPRRVEVHEKGAAMRVVDEDGELTAPGILKNAVSVRALFERDAAHEAVLRNLLERHGYEDLDAVRGEGREEGREEGRAQAIVDLLEARGIAVDEASRARVMACRDGNLLRSWLLRAATATTAAEVIA